MLTSLKIWYKNISAHCDPQELEQAILRIVVGLIVFLYFLYSYFSHQFTTQELIVFKIILVFEILAISIFISILSRKFKPFQRIVLGAWLDVSAATSFLALTSDIGVMLICVYLWVIFGNGFRYGKNYLYHAQALSIVGFLIAT